MGLLGASWGPLGASWGLLGAEGSNRRFVFPLLGISWGRPEALLGRLGRLFGRMGATLGPSWGPAGGLLGNPGPMLEASWAVLECRKPENARTRKTLKNILKTSDVGLLGPSWRSSRSALGASWGPLGPSWGHLGRLGALLGRLGGLWASSAAAEEGPRGPGSSLEPAGTKVRCGGGSLEKWAARP